MARRAALKMSILGLLSIRPMSGYEVRKHFLRALSPYWAAPLTQIYPTLRALQRAELIKGKTIVQMGRPNKRVFSLTRQGRRELTRWLATPIAMPSMHHEFLHKVFLMNLLAPEKALENVKDYLRRTEHWLANLLTIQRKMQPALRGPFRETVEYQLLSLEHLIRIAQTEVAGAKATLEHLPRLHGHASPASPSRGAAAPFLTW
jgi:DNA-binding PadR family transcriptional regulator